MSSLWPGFKSQPWQSIPRDFSLTDHTLPISLESAGQKMAQSPLNGTTGFVDSEEEGRKSTMDKWWLKNEMKGAVKSCFTPFTLRALRKYFATVHIVEKFPELVRTLSMHWKSFLKF